MSEVDVRRFGGGSLVLVMLSVGCVELEEGDPVDGLRHMTGSFGSDRDGRISFGFDALDGESLLLVGDVESPFLVFADAVEDPDGEQVMSADALWEEPRSLTGAVYPDFLTTLGWPLTDDGLSEGRWKLDLAVVEEDDGDYFYTRGVETGVDLWAKADEDYSGGQLLTHLVLAGSTAEDEEVIRAVEAALPHWQDLYAQIGIDVAFEWWEYPYGDLYAPGVGSGSDYLAISESTSTRAVNVVIVPALEGGEDLYGMAGGIPGPVGATGRSAVAISALTNAGPDLVFDDQDVRLLAETMAHEVGHYLGLFHPVEVTLDLWDALDDTPECGTSAACLTALGDNLMFPYPVCEDDVCAPQDMLTPLQGRVANHHVAVE